jgi:diguanylate cyclase (GGDEF)-like protein
MSRRPALVQPAPAPLAPADAVTGLVGHRGFHERLAAELARARRDGSALCVVLLDLDHFRVLNDAHGHAAGDAALREVAGRLGELVRDGDVLARLGADGFGLVLPGANGPFGAAVAERCCAAVARPTADGAALSCSAGVASFPADDPCGSRLLERAEGALRWAKRAGRAQVRCFDPREVAVGSDAEERAEVLALLARDDALTIVAQPIVELATGRIAGYEALARVTGTEPQRPPDQWFAQARRCGLGPALEARALARALALPDRPAGAYLALNVSPAALLSAEVAAVLPDDLGGLLIELTEDALFASDATLDAALGALRARGARIAVDDAGAGYSGLQQLLRVKPDVLKLDRSLIDGIVADESKIALVEALARFATTTGAAVCAEGIERLDELRLLARFDVTYGQGYRLGRPGTPWPAVDGDAAAAAAAEVRWGMRVAPGVDAAGGRATMGDVSDELSHVRTRADLDRALGRIERLLHADDIAVSRVLAEERCVETVSTHETEPDGRERFAFGDYATTERVVGDQVVGQIVAGDPAADPAEEALLRTYGFAAVLLAPIVRRGETVGLLEFYRRAPRPWTGTEVDQARVLANQLSCLLMAGSFDGADEAAAAATTPSAAFGAPAGASV